MVEQFREREGHYPTLVLADKIYRNRENLSYCKERGIWLSGPALVGRESVKFGTRRRIIWMNVNEWK